MSRKRRTNWRLPLSLDELAALAPAIWQAHTHFTTEAGYTLAGSSAIWRKRNGTLTARLAYRGGELRSLVITVRNISPLCLGEREA